MHKLYALRMIEGKLAKKVLTTEVMKAQESVQEEDSAQRVRKKLYTRMYIRKN
jgi:hypothetical protein